jgi:hypothetical protein
VGPSHCQAKAEPEAMNRDVPAITRVAAIWDICLIRIAGIQSVGCVLAFRPLKFGRDLDHDARPRSRPGRVHVARCRAHCRRRIGGSPEPGR